MTIEMLHDAHAFAFAIKAFSRYGIAAWMVLLPLEMACFFLFWIWTRTLFSSRWFLVFGFWFLVFCALGRGCLALAS
jgi:hypothetical protein